MISKRVPQRSFMTNPWSIPEQGTQMKSASETAKCKCWAKVNAKNTSVGGGVQMHDKSIPHTTQKTVKKCILLSLLPQVLVGIWNWVFSDYSLKYLETLALAKGAVFPHVYLLVNMLNRFLKAWIHHNIELTLSSSPDLTVTYTVPSPCRGHGVGEELGVGSCAPPRALR